MTTTTFFIIFIPILSIILLAVNLLLAPHNPYQEKDSPFECGFHSFSGQNRMQFNVTFFMFALLFLVFDVEIVLVYPYTVSSYTNDTHGLTVMLVFFGLLTLGFVFELGKNALSIDSRQTTLSSNEDLPQPHVFSSSQLVSGLDLTNIDKKMEDLQDKAYGVDDADTLKDRCNNDPKTIRETSDRLINDLKSRKEDILGEIEQKRDTTLNTNDHKKLDSLENQVKQDCKVGVQDAKEACNTGIDSIDDSEATEQYLYDLLPIIFINYPFVTVITILFRCVFNYSIGLYLSIYYNLLKNKINFVFITLSVLTLIYFLSDTLYCDAPKAWGLYFDNNSLVMEIIIDIYNYIIKLYDSIIELIHTSDPSAERPCGACWDGDCDFKVHHDVPVPDGKPCPCCGLIPGKHY